MLSLTLFYRKGLPFLNEHGLFVISIYTNYFTLSSFFMKKKLLLIFLIIIIFIGGYFVLNEYKKKNLVNDAQEKAEKYVMNNYEGVESVQVTPDNYRFKPMGTLG